MTRVAATLALLVALTAFSSVSYGGCSCTCVDGWRRGSCSNVYEVPPVCAQIPCPFNHISTAPNLAPVRGLRATPTCGEVKQCDLYDNCQWKWVCR